MSNLRRCLVPTCQRELVLPVKLHRVIAYFHGYCSDRCLEAHALGEHAHGRSWMAKAEQNETAAKAADEGDAA